FDKEYREKYREAYDPAVDQELVFSGSKRLTDAVSGSPLNAGKLVLSPTRTYAPIVKKILTELPGKVHGMVHCSGGAQTKVLHFVKGLKIIKDNLLEIPPLFRLIQEESGTDWKEMYQVFNMGHRYEVYLPEEYAGEVIAISKSFNVEAQIVGRVEAADQKEVFIQTPTGSYTYH
ncbi:MAG: AIR synthase-related protein, partial [Marinoscillum sp.]